MGNAKRKRVSKPPELRREELLAAASSLFAESGVAATGIGDITERAEVARGTFYLYFASKDDVVAELWRRYVAGFASLADALAVTPEGVASGQQVLDLLRCLTVHALRHAHLHRVVYGSADAPAIALCKQSDVAILERLGGAIGAHFAASGRDPSEVDLVASLLFHGLDGALHHVIMRDTGLDEPAFLAGTLAFAGKALGIEVRVDGQVGRPSPKAGS